MRHQGDPLSTKWRKHEQRSATTRSLKCGSTCGTRPWSKRVHCLKDNINFKGPGGGVACHQDVTAYATNRFSKRHVSVLLDIDEITENNGPLEVAPGEHKRGILSNTKGVTANQLEDTFEFSQVLASPGDLLLFDSYLPHRSAINTSKSWHRAAYFTFNAAREGDFHDEYYGLKKDEMARGRGGPVSINDDFKGDIVEGGS